MSNESEVRELFATDPHVSHELFGRLIEDAQARDRLAAEQAEAPEPAPEEWPAFATDEGHAAHLAAVVDGVSYTDALAAIRAARPQEDEPSRVEQLDHAVMVNVARTGLWKPEADAPPAVVAAYVLGVIDALARTDELLGESIDALNKLDDKRARDIEELTLAVETLARRADLRAEECTALGHRIESNARALASHVERDHDGVDEVIA
jgi:hypothetical protein